jgi:hypothetical protein
MAPSRTRTARSRGDVSSRNSLNLVGTSSRLRQAYVAAKFFGLLDLTARARHRLGVVGSSSLPISVSQRFERLASRGYLFGRYYEETLCGEW